MATLDDRGIEARLQSLYQLEDQADEAARNGDLDTADRLDAEIRRRYADMQGGADQLGPALGSPAASPLPPEAANRSATPPGSGLSSQQTARGRPALDAQYIQSAIDEVTDPSRVADLLHQSSLAFEQRRVALQASLQEIDEEQLDPVTLRDHAKSALGDLVRSGGNFLAGIERSHREEQHQQLEMMQRLGQGDPAKLKELRDKVAAGGQVKPTFYGSLIRPFFDAGKAGADVLGYAEQVFKSRSKAAQYRSEKPWFNPEAKVTNPEEWFEGTAMPWEDPEAFALAASSNAFGFTANVATAIVTGRLGAMAMGRLLRKRGVVNPDVIRKQAARVGQAVGAAAGTALEYVMVRDQVAQSTEEGLRAQWKKQELWDNHEEYQRLREAGYTDELAKQVMTTSYSKLAGDAAGITSAIFGAGMNKFFAKLGLAEAASRPGAALKGGLGELFVEGVQETTETLYQNIAENRIDPSKPLTEGLVNAFFGGAALGGPMGALAGAAAGGDHTQAGFNKDVKALNNSGFADWRGLSNERSKLQQKISDPEYMKTAAPAQRVQDFERLEEVQLQEAQAFLRAEPVIRRMQTKYGAEGPELKRTDVFAARAKATVASIDQARASRATAEQRAATEAQLVAERDEMLRQIEQDALTLTELKQQDADLMTLQGGGALAGDDALDRYEAIQKKGWGRWTNKARTNFVLTPAGRVAREAVAGAIHSTESKIESGYAGPERRSGRNAGLRARIEQMSDEELDRELYTDPVTKVRNRRAFDNAEAEGKAGAYAFIDLDSLKWFNDNWGDPKGDAALRKIASSAQAAGLEVYRTGGDEFVVRGETAEDVEAGMQEARRRLEKRKPIAGPDGQTAQATMTWGIGPDVDSANLAMKQVKERRTAEGKRAARGEPPPSLKVAQDPNAPQQLALPIMSQDDIGDGVDLAAQIESVTQRLAEALRNARAGAVDDVTFTRLRILKDRLAILKRREEEEAKTAAAMISERLRIIEQAEPVNELRKRWLAFPSIVKAPYEQRAAEFWAPLAGQHVSGLEVFLWQQGRLDLENKLPPRYTDDAGNEVDPLSSAMHLHLDRMIREDLLPPSVIRDVTRVAEQAREQGNTDATPASVLSHRVRAYLAGAYVHGSHHPFSADVKAWLDQLEVWTDHVFPIAMLAGDGIMTDGFYADLRRGDPVEVIVDGNAVAGTIASVDSHSFVVRWDESGPKVWDPDVRGKGNAARFSRQYGWQVSARMARGGKPYHKQGFSWAGQARLGRRWDTATGSWITGPQHMSRTVKIGRGDLIYPQLAPGTKNQASRNEMRRIRETVSEVLAGYRNMPNISIANTVAELPPHMQAKLAAHGSNGVGVAGMFDEVDPINGVWLLAGNIVAMARQNNISVNQMAAETVVHETIGHYGLRGFMGNDARMARWMDAVEQAAPDAVRRKGASYRFGSYNQKTNEFRWFSDEARRLAAEETLAEQTQSVYRDGKPLPAPQQSLLQRILSYFRAWMVDHGFGRHVRLTDADLARLLANAQSFVQNGRGWSYRTRTGQTLTPYMRDMDMFRAAILTQFYEGTRPTTKDERKAMQQRGLEPLRDVPIFPSEGLSVEAYRAAFKKLAIDHKISQAELEFVEIDDFLENLTYADYPDISDIPARLRQAANRLDMVAGYTHERAASWLGRLSAATEAVRTGRQPEMTFDGATLEALQADLDAWRAMMDKGGPDPGERSAAVEALAGVFRVKPGKKEKVPKGIIAAHLRARAVNIEVIPGVQYNNFNDAIDQLVDDGLIDPREGEAAKAEARVGGPDVTPMTWPYLAGDGSTAWWRRYIPVGSNEERNNVYVFRQINPAPSAQMVLSDAHNFGGHTKTKVAGAFAHFRYTEAVLPDGTTAYIVIETQGDPFQGKENTPHNDEGYRALQRTGAAYTAAAEAAARHMEQKMLSGILEGFSLRADDTFFDEAASVSSMNQEAFVDRRRDDIRRELQALVLAWYEPHAEKNEELIEKRGGLSSVDARAFDALDSQAIVDYGKTLHRALEAVSRTTWNPQNILGDQYSDFAVHVESALVSASGLNDLNDNPAARVLMKSALRNDFMEKVIARFAGQPFSADTAAALEAELLHSSAPLTATIPKEIVDQIKQLTGPNYLQEKFSGESVAANAPMRAYGYLSGRLLTGAENPDGSFTMRGYSATGAPPLSFAEAVKSYITDGLVSSSRSVWNAYENDRESKAVEALDDWKAANDPTRQVMDYTGARREAPMREATAAEWAQELERLAQEHPDAAAALRIKAVTAEEAVASREEAAETKLNDILLDEDLIDAFFGSLTDEDGIYLDTSHPEFERRAATGDRAVADRWLQAATIAAARREYAERGVVYERIYNEANENQPSRESEFRKILLPLAWDENGVVTKEAVAFVIRNFRRPSGGITDDFAIVIDGEFVDWWFDWERCWRHTIDWAVDRIDNDGGDVPSWSVFYKGQMPQPPEDLVRDAQRRDEPDFEEALKGSASWQFSDGRESPMEKAAQRLWEQRILVERKLTEVRREGLAPDSPLLKVWKQVLLRFAVADAVRKGHKTLIMHSGEATGSRGGWGSSHRYWDRLPEISWKKLRMDISGRETDVFEIEYQDERSGGRKTMILTEERMVPVLGADVTAELKNRALAGSYDPTEAAARSLDVVEYTPTLLVLYNNQTNTILGSYADKQSAEAERSRWIAELAAAPPVYGAVLAGGLLTRAEMGGTINIVPGSEMRTGYYGSEFAYQDTVTPDGSLAWGARTGYDIVNISDFRKLLGRFGVKIERGPFLPIDPSDTKTAETMDGARLARSSGEPAKVLRAEKLVSGKAWIVVSDDGLESTTVYPDREEAVAAIAAITDQDLHSRDRLMVYRIDLTQEAIDYFGAGSLPIMSQWSQPDLFASQDDPDPSVDKEPLRQALLNGIDTAPGSPWLRSEEARAVRWPYWAVGKVIREFVNAAGMKQNALDRHRTDKGQTPISPGAYTGAYADWVDQRPIRNDRYVSARKMVEILQSLREINPDQFAVIWAGLMEQPLGGPVSPDARGRKPRQKTLFSGPWGEYPGRSAKGKRGTSGRFIQSWRAGKLVQGFLDRNPSYNMNMLRGEMQAVRGPGGALVSANLLYNATNEYAWQLRGRSPEWFDSPDARSIELPGMGAEAYFDLAEAIKRVDPAYYAQAEAEMGLPKSPDDRQLIDAPAEGGAAPAAPRPPSHRKKFIQVWRVGKLVRGYLDRHPRGAYAALIRKINSPGLDARANVARVDREYREALRRGDGWLGSPASMSSSAPSVGSGTYFAVANAIRELDPEYFAQMQREMNLPGSVSENQFADRAASAPADPSPGLPVMMASPAAANEQFIAKAELGKLIDDFVLATGASMDGLKQAAEGVNVGSYRGAYRASVRDGYDLVKSRNLFGYASETNYNRVLRAIERMSPEHFASIRDQLPERYNPDHQPDPARRHQGPSVKLDPLQRMSYDDLLRVIDGKKTGWDAEIADLGLTSRKKVRAAAALEKARRDHLEPDPSAGLPIMMANPIRRNPHLASAAKKVGATGRKPSLPQRFYDATANWKARVNQGVFDKFSGIKSAMNKANWQGPAERDPYIQARFTTSLDSQMRAVLNYGHPVWKDGIMQVEGKGLLDILQPVSDPDTLELWSLYVVGKRAKRLKDEGRENLFTDDEIQAMIDVGNLSQVFEEVAREYAVFNAAMLDFAEQAGVINPTTRPLWEHADYVPFYRVQDDRLMGMLGSNRGIAGQPNPVKTLRGGTDALGDIPGNIVTNITNLIDISMKNHAARTAVDALKGVGLIRKIPNVQFDKALVPMDQVRKALIAAGLNPNHIPQAALTGMQEMFVAKPPSGEGVVSILRDGKREYYFTDDRLLFESMSMINMKQFGKWMQLFRGPKRFFTTMITLDPGFMLRNYIRDLLSSFVQSRDIKTPVTEPLGLPKHMLRSIQGYKQGLLKDQSMRTMMSAGAAFDSGYINYADPNSVGRSIRKAMRSRGFRVSLLDTPAKIFEFYKELGAGFENANRIAVYNEAIAAGRSKAQAAFEAKDLMDFSMSGSWPAVQFLVQSVPFMGARLQGMHRLGRGFTESPMAFGLKGLLLTLAGMSVYLMFADDERYQALEEWDKDTYFHFWIGGRHYRLPKPFEVGAIFNTIPERAAEAMRSEEGDAGRLLTRRMGFMLAETFSFNPTPQLASPAVEMAFNHNFFTGRSIVNPYEENRLPPDQFSPQTSPAMVELARLLPEGIDSFSGKLRSPKHLENLYRGYTGTLGQYALVAADSAVRHMLDYPSKPALSPSQYPVLGSFYRGESPDSGRTKYEEVFYETLRDALRVQGSLSFLDNMMLDDRLEYVEERYDPIIAITPELEGIRRRVGQLNREIFEVWNDPEMTPEEKRLEIDSIQADKNEEFKSAWPLRRGGKERQANESDLKFLLREFNVDQLPQQLSERHSPAAAGLVEDLLNLDQETLKTIAR
jgi:diguanylate cyclase (GGDEF)-like protein